MSSFQVTPTAVSCASLPLGAISGAVAELHQASFAHATAAGGTPAAGAVEGLMTRWSQVLPEFALSGERLAAAVTGAAASYEVTDSVIAGASEGEA
ncbi:MAG TPA: hypothetical protein VIJ20_06865 [Solirubrobacteraceae bacterium]